MANLERRIEVLERGTQSNDTFTVIAIQIVGPEGGRPENRFCLIDGVHYTCGADESPSDFDVRMHSIAEELNRRLGRPIRLVCSAQDLDL